MIRAARPVPEQEGDGNGSMLSVVIPIHNEEGNVVALCRNLSTVLDRLQRPYEVLLPICAGPLLE